MEHEQKRQELSQNAKRKASVFTWKKAAERIGELFYKSYQRFDNLKSTSQFPVRFFRHYDKGTECIYSKAVRAFSGRELPIEDALAFSLRRQHTPMEVLIVLEYLLGKEKAMEVFERVFKGGGEKNG